MKHCRAKLHTKALDEEIVILKKIGEHLHGSTAASTKMRSVMKDIKEKAETTPNTSRSIISTVTENLNECELAQMPAMATVSRNIRRIRQKAVCAPPIPQTRNGYDIPEEYAKLNNEDLFLQYDSGKDDVNRMVIFASDKGLDDICLYNNWGCDGTFKVCPSIFYQLYTIHIVVGEICVPRIFALLPNKSQVTYHQLFSRLLYLRPNVNPASVMLDFEKASMNAINMLFPEAQLSGCLFHLCQSVYRKIVELGFKNKYNNEEIFSLKCRCLSALSFLPVSDVIDGFEQLIDDDDLPQELVAYFEVNYIGCLRGRGQNIRRLIPNFPIEIWNSYERFNNNMPRTNNSIEAYHNALQSSLSCSHPNIWMLISALKKEESLSKTKVMQFEVGRPIQRQKRYKDKNVRLENIVSRYDPENKVKFLKCIGHNLKY